MTPADQIWALVSGLPSGRRKTRLLYMLQAFVDDSRIHHHAPRLFALGGYIAPAERWAEFSDAWQAVLDVSPRLKYFKYREALTQKKQFYCWDEEVALQRAQLFREVIERFDLRHFSIVFDVDAYRRVFGHTGKLRNPYYFAAIMITRALARRLEDLGFERQQIDFIFDRQYMEEHHVLRMWNEAVRQVIDSNMITKPPDLVSKIFVNPPTFRDDIDVLPLQAADMHVTHTRISAFNIITGKSSTVPSWPIASKPLQGVALTYNEAELRAELKVIEPE